MSGFFGKDREMEIWAEKYRPETLEDYVGNDHIKDKVKRYIEDDDIPHLLFHSKKPGTGKCLGQSEMVDVKIRAFDKNERELRLPVGRLFELLGVDNNKYDEFQKVDWDVSIKDPSGEYVSINSFVKKKGDVFSYQFRDGTSITCDENHLVKNWKAGEFQRICNVQFVKTPTGKKKIVDKKYEGFKDVYDFSLDDPHEYVTSSGIVCHNTSLAKIIVNNINCQHMYINASDENSVDTMRNKIKQYASNVAINNLNVIILDECLEEGTKVTVLRNGDEIKVPIETLDDESDLVKSYDLEKEKVQWRPFNLFDKGKRDVYEIELGNGQEVVCTGDHKWYVEDQKGEVKVVQTTDLKDYNHILSP